MARISIDNGQSTVDVGRLDPIQPARARKVAESKHPELSSTITAQNHFNTFSWLVSFCDEYERVHGVVFATEC